MSSKLSGAQRGRKYSVARSTEQNWLEIQRENFSAHLKRVANGGDEFGTDPEMSGNEDEETTLLRPNKRTGLQKKLTKNINCLFLADPRCTKILRQGNFK